MPTTERAKAAALRRAQACGYARPEDRWSCGRCKFSSPAMHKSDLRCTKHNFMCAKGGCCDDFMPMMPRQPMQEVVSVLEVNRRYDAKIEAAQIEAALTVNAYKRVKA